MLIDSDLNRFFGQSDGEVVTYAVVFGLKNNFLGVSYLLNPFEKIIII